MYTITLDTAKNFECTLKIQGASLNKSKVNLVIESNDMDIRCRGTITEKGKVSIPVKKLKGILEENSKGKMYLEVIAEDSYFTPYKTDYITELSKKVNLKENVKITEVNQTVIANVTTNHPENIIYEEIFLLVLASVLFNTTNLFYRVVIGVCVWIL